MMINFKDFISGLNHTSTEGASAQVTSKVTGQTLFLKFSNKDILTNASYEGPVDPWLGSMCSIIVGKTMSEITKMSWKNWDQAFGHDQTFWDIKMERSEEFFFAPLELLRAGIDSYRGKEHLYKEPEALICRCFGVRENDVLDYIRSTDDPTPEGLATASKAGMGCRSCVTQLTKWLSVKMPKSQAHFFKEKSRAHWLLEIDYMLSCFPEAADWKMEVNSFQGSQVSITFDKDVSQKEEEEVSIRLQDFLAAGLDSDLSFFLIRARQRSKA